MENELEFMKQNMQDAAALHGRENSRILSILSVPRQLMASTDVSAILRQGIVPVFGGLFSTSRSRRRWTRRAIADSFRKAFSEQAYNEWNYDLRHSADFEDIRESKLALTDIKNPDLTMQEERYMGNFFDEAGVVGKFVNTALLGWSERHYVGFLNQMRVGMFRMYSDQLKQRGITPENSPEMYKAMAGYINSATGRGNLNKFFEKNATALNATLFAPRLIASRINMLTYLGRWVGSKKFRDSMPKEVMHSYFGDMFKTAVGGFLTMGMLSGVGALLTDDDDEHHLGGWKDTNTLSDSDFGNYIIQDTRFDVWGGFKQYAALIARYSAGVGKAYSGFTTGAPSKTTFGQDVADPLFTFMRYKTSPVAGMTWDLATGRTAIGEEIRLWNEGEGQISMPHYVAQHLLPLGPGGLLLDWLFEDERVTSTPGVKLAGFVAEELGISSNTYHKKPKSGRASSKPLTRREVMRQQRKERVDRRKEIRERRRKRNNE